MRSHAERRNENDSYATILVTTRINIKIQKEKRSNVSIE